MSGGSPTFRADATNAVVVVVNGVQIFDVRNPKSPVKVANLQVKSAVGADLSGNIAYVIVRDANPSALQVFDITSPAKPVLKSVYALANSATGISVAGTHAYISKGPDGIDVIDISDPTHPEQIRSYETMVYSPVSISQNRLYVLDPLTSGLVILGDPGMLSLSIVNQGPAFQLRVGFTAGSSLPVILEASSDLQTWSPIWTNILSQDFAETSPLKPKLFFRARQ
jgi:hypothetical protein